MSHAPRSVTTLRVSPPNQRPFDVHVYTAKLSEKLLKYPGAVILGETMTPAAGIIPTHIGKTAQQEKAEKAAAKLASQNQQRGSVKAKAPKPEKPVKPAKPKEPSNRGFTEVNARPIVCLTTKRYYRSMRVAEHKTGVNRSLLCYLFSTRPAPIQYKGHIYDYATESEHKAGRCHRSVKSLPSLPDEPRRGRATTPRKALIVIDTGLVYRTTGELAQALHISKRWINRLTEGEIRQTPVGAIRLATAGEVEQWKQLNGK